MKKLQMRMGNNAPLDINQEYEKMQNNEIDELAQMFTPTSIEASSKDKTITDESNTKNISNTVKVSLDNIIPSKHNKFKQYEGEKQAAMIESIKEQGIIVPLTLRKIDLPGNYEIISGENRWRCAKLAGLTHVPSYIVDCDDETAIMRLTEANLVNRDISLYERVQAYKQQYEIMKKKSGTRTDLQENAEKTNSLDELARKHGASRTQMHRLIRIADLAEPLVELVDKGKIASDAAVKLVVLSSQNQLLVADYLNDNSVKLHNSHAELIVKNSEKLSMDILGDIFSPAPQRPKPVKSVKTKRFSRFFENITDSAEIEKIIEKALQMYFSNEKQLSEFTQCDEIE